MELAGTNALVTGGASGIGAATVARLRSSGATVAVLDLQQPATCDLFVRCDVADEDQVVAGVGRVRDELGGVHAAVLAAGVGGMSPVLELESAEWDRVVRVNLRGAYLCLRECGRAMVRDQTAGSIVAVTSVSGSLTERLMAHYSVSKAGLNALVRTAARELGPHGIRVNAVAPGTTDTPMFAPTERLPGYRERVSKQAALGRLGTADEVAQAIVATLALDWVTGQVIAADGGLSLASPLDPADSLRDRP